MTERVILIRWSKDGGRNWSAWQQRSLGETGEFLKPVIVRRLGRGKHWTVEFKVTDPVRADVLAGAVQLEQTES